MTKTIKTVGNGDGRSAQKSNVSSQNRIAHGTVTLLDVKHVAAMLSLAPKTVYKLVAEKKIPHVKLGRSVRFEPDAVVAWVSESRVPSRGW